MTFDSNYGEAKSHTKFIIVGQLKGNMKIKLDRFLQFIELDVLLRLCDFAHHHPFALNTELLLVFKRQLR